MRRWRRAGPGCRGGWPRPLGRGARPFGGVGARAARRRSGHGPLFGRRQRGGAEVAGRSVVVAQLGQRAEAGGARVAAQGAQLDALALHLGPEGGQLQRLAEFGDAADAVFGVHRQRAVDGAREGGRQRQPGGVGQPGQRVLQQPRHRGGDGLAGDQEVQHRAQAVDVGPGALLQHAVVLLDGGEAGLDDHRQRLRGVAHGLPRGAEVQQHRHAGVQHHDVVGRDVAVVAVVGVQQLQRVEDGRQHVLEPGLAGHQPGLGLAQRAQGAALAQLHGHVGGTVLLPEAVDADQRRVVELRQQARLVQKAVQPARQGGLHLRLARDHAAVGRARGECTGHVFLDGDSAPQRVVVRTVDRGKTAFAQHAAQLELGQARAGGQAVGGCHQLLVGGGGRRGGGGQGHEAGVVSGKAALLVWTMAALSTRACRSNPNTNVRIETPGIGRP